MEVNLVLVFIAKLGLVLEAGEVEGVSDILDDDNGLVGGGDEEMVEVGVGGGEGELEVINVEPERLAMLATR